MSTYIAASLLAAQLATAPAPEASMPAQAVPEIPADWSDTSRQPRPAPLRPRDSQPAPSAGMPQSAARPPGAQAVRQLIEAERASGEAVAHEGGATLRGSKYDAFATAFGESAVPGCLRPDGLKRQPTGIGPFQLGGLLALPFVAVAKLRGKCN